MSTVTVTTSADAAVNDGSAVTVTVVNTGPFSAFIRRGAGPDLLRKLRPGERQAFSPEGMALTARGADGPTTLEVAATAAASSGITNAVQRTGEAGAVDLSAATVTLPSTTAGLTKTTVGLGNVANTSDAAKPVSAAQQTALDAKAPLASPAFTGTVDLSGAASVLLPNATTASGFTLPILGPTRRVPYRAPTYAQLFQTGHGWTATGAGVGSSSLNDTTAYVRGTQSARVTTAGNGSQAAIRVTGLAAKDLTNKMLRWTFKVDDVTHLSSILAYAGSSAFANYFNWTLHTHSASSVNFVQSGEWVTITAQWANVQTASGSYSVTNGLPSTTVGFTDFQLAFFDDAAGAITLHLQSFEIVPDTATTFPNGVVSITFDDSYQSVYDYARPYMENLGFRGTLYTIADVIGTSGTYQTLSELKQLQQYSGWEIAGHAYAVANHNAGYQTLTAAQVRTELRNLKAWLLTNGFPADSFAYPLGRYDSTTDGVAVDSIVGEFFTTGRSIISEMQESWPPAMERRMRAKTGVSSVGTAVGTLTAAGGVLDRCLNDGAWYQLCLHKIVTGTATVSTEISQTDFQTLMDAISSRGIPVLPVGEITRYYS